jgi:hypothetical protein
MPRADIERIERDCAAGMVAMGYAFTGSPPVDRQIPVLVAGDRPSFVVHAFKRLRYYGTNGDRWRRGALRWKIMLRVRARYIARMGLLRGRS